MNRQLAYDYGPLTSKPTGPDAVFALIERLIACNTLAPELPHTVCFGPLLLCKLKNRLAQLRQRSGKSSELARIVKKFQYFTKTLKRTNENWQLYNRKRIQLLRTRVKEVSFIEEGWKGSVQNGADLSKFRQGYHDDLYLEARRIDLIQGGVLVLNYWHNDLNRFVNLLLPVSLDIRHNGC